VALSILPLKLKGNFYMTTIQLTMLYGALVQTSECWPIKRIYSTGKCCGNAYIALDLWSYKKGSNPER
jgi:hypothetical protein